MMQRHLPLLLASLLSLAGCAGAYDYKKPDGEAFAGEPGSDVTCTREIATGTRFVKPYCASKADREARTAAAQREADSLRARPPEIKY